MQGDLPWPDQVTATSGLLWARPMGGPLCTGFPSGRTIPGHWLQLDGSGLHEQCSGELSCLRWCECRPGSVLASG